MSWLKRLQEKKQSIKEQADKRIQRGRERTAQMKADKLRKRSSKAQFLKPGTFRYGLYHRQGIGDFMKDVKERRKQKREQEDQ